MYSWKEIINDLLHVVCGFILAYLFIPTAPWWIVSLFVLAIASVREHIQMLRGHAQKAFHRFTDPLGFLLGAVLFLLVRNKLPLTQKE